MSDINLNVRMILPMKINKIPKGKENLLPSLCASGDYFGEIKKDGYWYEYEKQEDRAYLFSSTVSAVTGTLVEKSANVPHIMSVLNILPPDTILIGEIYYPDGTSKDVTPIMGSLPEKAIERQEKEYGLLHYYIHDILYYDGTDLRKYGSWIRYQILRKVYFKHGLNLCDTFIELADAYEENLFDKINEVLESGEEGMVLKKRSSPYYEGKRSPVWETIKVKKTDTCDAIIMGFCKPTKYYDGKLDVGVNYSGKDAESWPYWVIEEHKLNDKGWTDEIISEIRLDIDDRTVIKGMNYGTFPVTKAYYYGWITSVRVGAFDDNGNMVEIGTISSGLTDELEADMAANPTNYIGRVAELAGMEKNCEDHTLRHFFFKNIRIDKTASECTIKEIF